eukprot:GCRY01005806.1.p1 GENE.GCRY01005806.1~~GCRY01005806.1.p1  ORF type:complete len:886 (+),score=49.76 GCRY01005806.1:163-2820(+)
MEAEDNSTGKTKDLFFPVRLTFNPYELLGVTLSDDSERIIATYLKKCKDRVFTSLSTSSPMVLTQHAFSQLQAFTIACRVLTIPESRTIFDRQGLVDERLTQMDIFSTLQFYTSFSNSAKIKPAFRIGVRTGSSSLNQSAANPNSASFLDNSTLNSPVNPNLGTLSNLGHVNGTLQFTSKGHSISKKDSDLPQPLLSSSNANTSPHSGISWGGTQSSEQGLKTSLPHYAHVRPGSILSPQRPLVHSRSSSNLPPHYIFRHFGGTNTQPLLQNCAQVPVGSHQRYLYGGLHLQSAAQNPPLPYVLPYPHVRNHHHNRGSISGSNSVPSHTRSGSRTHAVAFQSSPDDLHSNLPAIENDSSIVKRDNPEFGRSSSITRDRSQSTPSVSDSTFCTSLLKTTSGPAIKHSSSLPSTSPFTLHDFEQHFGDYPQCYSLSHLQLQPQLSPSIAPAVSSSRSNLQQSVSLEEENTNEIGIEQAVNNTSRTLADDDDFAMERRFSNLNSHSVSRPSRGAYTTLTLPDTFFKQKDSVRTDCQENAHLTRTLSDGGLSANRAEVLRSIRAHITEQRQLQTDSHLQNVGKSLPTHSLRTENSHNISVSFPHNTSKAQQSEPSESPGIKTSSPTLASQHPTPTQIPSITRTHCNHSHLVHPHKRPLSHEVKVLIPSDLFPLLPGELKSCGYAPFAPVKQIGSQHKDSEAEQPGPTKTDMTTEGTYFPPGTRASCSAQLSQAAPNLSVCETVEEELDLIEYYFSTVTEHFAEDKSAETDPKCTVCSSQRGRKGHRTGCGNPRCPKYVFLPETSKKNAPLVLADDTDPDNLLPAFLTASFDKEALAIKVTWGECVCDHYELARKIVAERDGGKIILEEFSDTLYQTSDHSWLFPKYVLL